MEMNIKQNLRDVKHPERLYIQINDEDVNTLSFSFNDDTENSVGLNPNAFDKETLQRCEMMLSNVFLCVHNLRVHEDKIKPI